MLKVGQALVRNCQGVTRRELLRVAGLGAVGLTLADWLRNKEVQAKTGRTAGDVSCIFLWLDGGPSHFETFDPKPLATEGIRGPYGAISTSVPGIQIGELLPMLARQMDKCAILRSLNHSSGSHSAIPMLSGLPGERTAYGAVVSKLKGFRGNMPPYVHLGSAIEVGGGRLGVAYDPVKVSDPSGKKVKLPQFSLSAPITPERFQSRRDLLAALDGVHQQMDAIASVQELGKFRSRAFDILTTSKVREAFDMDKESDSVRERYGANFFGQSCLMARRLVEAGSRFVQIKWYDGPAWDAWDVHGADLGGMVRMEQHLCPRFDLGLSALLEDLDQRGMLESTLVVAVGEFGRTPKLNKSGARDHWPYCFSALLAGGGVMGGKVVGASDAQGGRPSDRPISPAEFAATIYRLLGIDTLNDPRIRPFTRGAQPVSEIVY